MARLLNSLFIAACIFQTSCLELNAQDSKTDSEKSPIGSGATGGRLVPWTASAIKGSPDPPLPYRIERVFTNVKLERPTDVVWLPDADRWIATQNSGQVVTFENDPQNAQTSPLLNTRDIHEGPLYSIIATKFHHDLANHPWCYITYTSERKQLNGTHLGRLRVIDPSVPTVDPNSLVVVASWNSEGHSGGAMQFGPDGMFYVSVGDGQNPYPPDGRNTGQDLSDLEASVLRIDIDNPTENEPYRVPKDNPFVGMDNVRPEIWSFGFRNPWKMAFDPETGELLCGDVGWESREMVRRITRGSNHGWSITEGSQAIKPDQQPTVPITPPLFEHTRIDSRSITGGDFWHSDRLPELKGAYLYGDWVTGKVWALKSEGDRVVWHKELVDTPMQIICFMLDPSGEVLIVGFDGSIARLQPNDTAADQQPFPTKLSETGLFADVVQQTPATGVVEYDIASHHWADGTQSRRWIALPDDNQLRLFEKSNWQVGQVKGKFDFPSDTVMVKTVSYLGDSDDPSSERRLETQILHRLGDEWQAYNYVWNESQTDATLQDDLATERKLKIKDDSFDSGFRTQTWRHSSRSECKLCHSWGVGTVHAFAAEQLNFTHHDENQLDRFVRLGVFESPIDPATPLPSPHDTSKPIESRARTYLALNCATCHQPLGGGTANFDFELGKPIEECKYVDAVPAQGTFGIPEARILAPGDPLRSVLLFRSLKSGRGHMPQFGSNVTDMRGVRLLHDWIDLMAVTGDSKLTWDQQLAALSNSASDSDETDRQISKLLRETASALALSLACTEDTMDASLKLRVIEIAIASDKPEIRDLFEHFLPEDQRIKRLGPTIDESALLAMQGSAERGKQLFEHSKEINCKACHRVGTVGQVVGPDLSGIGTQQTPDELLASVLRPSEKIDTKYRGRKILTVDGDVMVGIVTTETSDTVSIADSTGKLHQIATDDIEVMQGSATSVMPDKLLAGMTAQQAADLLAFLSAQRKIGPLQHKHAVIYKTDQPITIDGKRDEPAWSSAQPVGDFVFTWWNDGDGPRQQTDARMLWDDDNLYVSFYCTDSNITAIHSQRDSKVYRDDCVEVFGSPELDHPENYFNLEMNALGAQLDNYRPQGQDPETEWNPDGITVAVSVDGTLNESGDQDSGWLLEVAIPFKIFANVLPNGHPSDGDQWRLNLNRLDDQMKVKSQWSQGDRNFPRFHAPEFFGFVTFSNAPPPSAP